MHTYTHMNHSTGNAAKTGRSVEINDVLRNVRSALQNQRSLVKEEFDALDKDRDGCLHHLDVVRLVRLFCQGVCFVFCVRVCRCVKRNCTPASCIPSLCAFFCCCLACNLQRVYCSLIRCQHAHTHTHTFCSFNAAGLSQREVRHLLMKIMEWDTWHNSTYFTLLFVQCLLYCRSESA